MKSRKSGSGAGYGHRRMLVEKLERRSMLAGNVTVFESGGSLFVRGDNADNAVLIQQTGDDEYTITGLDFAESGDLPDPPFSGGPTTLNGGVDFIVLSGITGDINVDLRKGDDVLGIGNTIEDLATLAAECGFGFGFGSASGSASFPSQVEPEITGDRFIVPRNLIVNTNDGSDGVFIVADVRRNAIINTGNGFDAVAIGATVPDHEEHSVIGDDLVISTGNQDDVVCIHGLFIQDQVVIDTAAGNDDVTAEGWDARGVTIVTGNGNDLVDLFSFDLDNQLVVNTGAGNDDVFLEDFSAGQGNGPNGQRFAGYVTVVTGNGNDDVELIEFDANGVTINTGAGNDGTPNGDSPITVFDAEIYTDQNGNGDFDEGEPAGPLTIVTGAGNDLVSVEALDAGSVVIDTGAGNDGSASNPIAVVDAFILRSLVVVTGSGNDNALIDFADIGNLIINLGSGNDLLGINDVDVDNNVVIDAGAGNDRVTVNDGQVGGTTTIVMGAGNDTLSVFLSTSRRTVLLGGSGSDTLNNDAGIDSNGSFDSDGDGENDTIVQQFEFFGFPE
jgi:hypothetical protein